MEEHFKVPPWLEDILRYTQAPQVTGMTVYAEKERKVNDKAVALLQEQRFDEAQRVEYEKANVIVDAVNDLNIANIPDGVAVRFIKTFNGGEEYVFLAQRVINDRIGKAWYVTGRQGPLTDIAFESLLAEKGGFSDFIVVYGTYETQPSAPAGIQYNTTKA